MTSRCEIVDGVDGDDGDATVGCEEDEDEERSSRLLTSVGLMFFF